MRFTAERESILSALAFVAKYASSKDTIPILTQVLLRAEEKHIIATSTDLDRVAEDSFEAEVSEPGAICLPADLLLRSIKSATGSEVSVSSDGRQATVTCGRSNFKLPVLLAVDFPEMKMLTGDASCSFELPAGTIHQAAVKVGFSISTEKVRYWLQGVSWLVNDKVLEFCATDGSMLSLLSVPAPIQTMPHVIVPEFDLPAWEGPVEVSLTENFIRYRHADQTIASKLVEGTFPEYHRVIPKHPAAVRFDRAEMLAAITQARLVADAREHSILFAGKDGIITISARTMRGEASGTIAYEGDDFRIAVAAGVIGPILKSFDCEIAEWRIADAGSPTSIHDPNDASRITVAMPYYDARVAQQEAA